MFAAEQVNEYIYIHFFVNIYIYIDIITKSKQVLFVLLSFLYMTPYSVLLAWCGAHKSHREPCFSIYRNVN